MDIPTSLTTPSVNAIMQLPTGGREEVLAPNAGQHIFRCQCYGQGITPWIDACIECAICGFFAQKAALFLNRRLTTVIYFTRV